MLHGKEKQAWGDASYQGVDKRQEMQGCKAAGHVAMRPGRGKALYPKRELHKLLDMKASPRAGQGGAPV